MTDVLLRLQEYNLNVTYNDFIYNEAYNKGWKPNQYAAPLLIVAVY